MKKLLLFFIATAAIVSVGCRPRSEYRRVEGGVWNTTYHITYKSDRSLDDSIVAVMKQVELSLSPFNDSSLISRINRGETAETDSLIRRVFVASLEVNRRSGGLFDPTVGPLTNLWGFGYKNKGSEPTQAEIDSVLETVGLADCRLVDGKIEKKSPGTQFNFSAITKGMGSDLVGEMLRRNGVEDYMVEIGGEIALSGVNDRGKPWRIMVDAPIENDTAVVHQRMTVIEPLDRAVATSGDYRNFRQTSQGRVGHTLNPLTGQPARGEALSVTVLAPDCMTADAYATACMTMTAADALKMIEAVPRVDALIVTLAADSTYTLSHTSGFPPLD